MSDWKRTRDNFFTQLFHLMLLPVGLIIEIFSVVAIFYLLKMDIAKNFGWAIGIGVGIWILILVLRLKYFEDIPQGYTYSEWHELRKIRGKGSFWNDSFNKKYWITVLVICSWFVILGFVSQNSNMFIAIPSTLTLSLFAFLYMVSYRDAKKKGKIKDNTRTILKRLPLVFAPIGIFLTGVLGFLGLGIKNSGLGLLIMIIVIIGGMYAWYRYTKTKYPRLFYNNDVAYANAKRDAMHGKNLGRRALVKVIIVCIIVGIVAVMMVA